MAIDLHGGPRSAWLTWASRAPVRVGYDVPGRRWMYTKVVHRPRELRPRHSVENQWDLLAAARRVVLPRRPIAIAIASRWPSSADASRDAAARLTSLGIPGERADRHPARERGQSVPPLAGTGVRGSGGVARGRGSGSLGAPHGRPVRSRRRGSRAAVGAASARAAAAARIVNAEGLSLAELRALFDRAALFVGGDSGPLHIASTSDVPIVGLFGPTLVERSAPWRPATIATASVDAGTLPCRPCDQRVCAPGDFRCLSMIGAERVREQAERLLAMAS